MPIIPKTHSSGHNPDPRRGIFAPAFYSHQKVRGPATGPTNTLSKATRRDAGGSIREAAFAQERSRIKHRRQMAAIRPLRAITLRSSPITCSAAYGSMVMLFRM